MRWFKGLALIAVFVGIALILVAPKGSAQSFTATGNDQDNPSGETISILATQETLDYIDANSNASSTQPADNLSYVVSPEYGFSGIGDVTDQIVVLGELVTHEDWGITNEGNTDDTYQVTFLYSTTEASNWTVEVWENNNGSLVTTLVPETPYVANPPVLDNSDKFYNMRVEVPDNEQDAPNNSSILIIVTAETSNSPYGEYPGGNAYTYAGKNISSDEVSDSLSAPILTLTRVTTIDAPKVYSGTHYDPVPGAIITFTMTYSNEGSATAESVVLIDKIPDNTHMAHVNTNGNTTNVTIEAAAGDATGWTAFYSTLASPDKTYGNTGDWTLIGTLSAGNEEFPGSDTTWTSGEATWEATFIKWEKSSIPTTEDTAKLTWGVTID
jgi:uncharacterized repeat protein (TIGR01451 family)